MPEKVVHGGQDYVEVAEFKRPTVDGRSIVTLHLFACQGCGVAVFFRDAHDTMHQKTRSEV